MDGFAFGHHEQPGNIDVIFVVFQEIELFLFVFGLLVVSLQVFLVFDEDVQVLIKDNGSSWVVLQDVVDVLRIIVVLARGELREQSLIQKLAEVVSFQILQLLTEHAVLLGGICS